MRMRMCVCLTDADVCQDEEKQCGQTQACIESGSLNGFQCRCKTGRYGLLCGNDRLHWL